MNIEALPFLYEPEPRALNNAIAAFLGHKVVGLAPVVISGDNGEPFVADFGPENTLRGYAYVNPNWDRKDGIQDAETPRYHGVPECWLEVVPNYAKSMDTLAPLLRKLAETGWRLTIQSHDSGNWTCVLCKDGHEGMPTGRHAVMATAVCQAVSQIKE